jgi:hypothetical protein
MERVRSVGEETKFFGFPNLQFLEESSYKNEEQPAVLTHNDAQTKGDL